MSFEGQDHHPHIAGTTPNEYLMASDTPIGMELVQLSVFIRHGERTPVSQRMTGLAGMPKLWNLCSTGREFITNVTTLTGEQPMKVKRMNENVKDGNGAEIGPENQCHWGQLTDLGKASANSYGTKLRTILVEELKFLPSIIPTASEEIVTFRSTGMPRTIETLHHVVQGLFPVRDGAVEYVVRAPEYESLYPNSMCTRMRKLDREATVVAAAKYNSTLEPLDASISKYIDRHPVRIDGKPLASGILDTVTSARAHGIKLPKEFEDVKILETLEKAVVHEWFDVYENPEFKRLAMGRLLGDLKSTIARKIMFPKDPLKLSIMSLHDTSLAGITNSLGVFDGRWPPFTSNITFELFKSTTPPSFFSSFFSTTPHYIRMKFNQKVLVPPTCGKSIAGLCTFEEFKLAIKDVEITNSDWKKVCDESKGI